MNDQEITQLITRVLANEASANETKRLEEWRKAHADNEVQFQQTRMIWDNAALFKDDVDTDAAWEKFSSRIKTPQKTFTLRYYLQMAAATIIIGGAILLVANLLIGPSMQTVQTASNEMKEVKLPDGSTAWLNHDSRIEYEEDFDGKTRAIRLNGEAFFEVVKNPEKPFVITSAHSVTTVLGTSFNLSAYDSLEEVKLAVATGRVSFVSSKTKAEVIVSANENASIDVNGEALKGAGFNSNEMAWKTRTLKFQDTPLPEVFRALEHYYNVKISVSNPDIDSNCRFTGEFKNPTLKEMLDIIDKALDLTHTYNPKTRNIVFSGRGCR